MAFNVEERRARIAMEKQQAEDFWKEIQEIRKKSPDVATDKEIELVTKVFNSSLDEDVVDRFDLVYDSFSRGASKGQISTLMNNCNFRDENLWAEMFCTLEDIPQDRKLGKFVIQCAGEKLGKQSEHMLRFYKDIFNGYYDYPNQLIRDSEMVSEILKTLDSNINYIDARSLEYFLSSDMPKDLTGQFLKDVERQELNILKKSYDLEAGKLQENTLDNLKRIKSRYDYKWSKKDLVDIFGQEQADKIAKELDIPESTSDIVSKETTELKKASDALRSGKKEDVLKYLESKGVDLSSLDKEERELLENICENGCKGGKAALKKAGKEFGEKLLKKAPVIGVCICLGSAAAYAEEGNYSKAIAEAAGAIPIVGDFAEGGHTLYEYLTTDHLELGGSGSENGVDANLTYKSSEITEGSGIESLPEDYNGELLYGGEGKDGGDPNNWRQAIVEEGKDQPSGSGNAEGGIEAQEGQVMATEGQSSGKGVSAQDGQVVAKVGDKVAQEGDVIATDPTKVAKVGEKGATIFDEPVADVNHVQKNASTSEETKNGQVAKKDSAKSIENPSSIKGGSAKSTKNEKVENEEEYINKIMSSASTYYDDRIKNLFSSDEKCKELMNFLSSKGISIPADPEIIFQTMYFTKDGNAIVTFFTDKNGKNFLGTSPEQREELRDKMQKQHEISGAKGRVVASNSYDGKTSGSDKLDNALAQNDAKKATLAQNGAKKTTQTPALTNDINSGNTLA